MEEEVIRVEGLRKAYGTTLAVDDVTFSVRRGEIFGVVGPNGAGKTTTVECLSGLRRPDAGKVNVLGLDPVRDGRRLRQRLGVQLQEAALPEEIRVWEALDLYASFYEKAADWRPLLEGWGLEEKRNSRFKQLSGGQKQRLFIALALVNEPEVVFLDEITTGLDPQARRATWGLVRGIRERGTTVVLVTHLMDEAEKLCDRVAIVDGGRIVALDSPEALVRGLGAENSVRLGGVGVLDPASLLGVPGVSRAERDGDTVIAFGDRSLLPRVIVELDRRGIIPSDVGVGRPTLEDVFIEKTGREIRD